MTHSIITLKLTSLAVRIIVTATIAMILTSCSYSSKQSIDVTHMPIVNKSVSQDNFNSIKSDIIYLGNSNSIENPNNQQLITQANLADNSSLSSNTRSDNIDIYYFTSTLMMPKIYQIVQGRFIVENNCLFFERYYYDTLNLLTPLFDPESTVEINIDESILTLNGTTVKLGERISTSGNIKDEYKFHALYNYEDAKIVDNNEDKHCFADQAIFMSGNVRH